MLVACWFFLCVLVCFTGADPACSAHVNCRALHGNCCPNDRGTYLSCCASEWVFCAKEGYRCPCIGSVRYGKGNRWSKPKESSGSISCNNRIFGDPLHGTRKECQCKAAPELPEVSDKPNNLPVVTRAPTFGGSGSLGPGRTECTEHHTPDRANSYLILSEKFPQSSGAVQTVFSVRARNDAHIGFFTSTRSYSEVYEIVIGGWENTRSVIRRSNQGEDVAVLEEQGLVSPTDYTTFWASVRDGHVQVGTGRTVGQGRVLMQFSDPNPHEVHYLGLMSGWGSSADWKVCLPSLVDQRSELSCSDAPCQNGGLCIDANYYPEVGGGGWIPCYTTQNSINIEHPVPSNRLHFGQDQFQNDCRTIPFTDVLFVNHENGEKAWFTKDDGKEVTMADGGYNRNTRTTFTGHGVAALGKYQLNICGNSSTSGFQTGLQITGYVNGCYKKCSHWCGDTRSQYFRASVQGRRQTSYGGVAFKENGHRTVKNKLMSVLIRRRPGISGTSQHLLVSGAHSCTETGAPCKKEVYCGADILDHVPTQESNMERASIGVTCCDREGIGSRPDCLSSVTYAQAARHCKEKGLNLCTSQQIRQGAGEATGCKFDHGLVWTSDQCDHGTVPGSGGSAATSQAETLNYHCECPDFTYGSHCQIVEPSYAAANRSLGSALCKPPLGWCNEQGQTLFFRDCDEDGLPDPVCYDTLHFQVEAMSSSTNCTRSAGKDRCSFRSILADARAAAALAPTSAAVFSTETSTDSVAGYVAAILVSLLFGVAIGYLVHRFRKRRVARDVPHQEQEELEAFNMHRVNSAAPAIGIPTGTKCQLPTYDDTVAGRLEGQQA